MALHKPTLTESKQRKLDTLRLTIQLQTPAYLLNRTLRSILPITLWNKMTECLIRNSQGTCSCCFNTSNQLKVFEEWEYIRNAHKLTLIRLNTLCENCFYLKDFHKTIRHLDQDQLNNIIKHFMKVNNCDYEIFQLHLRELKIKEYTDKLSLIDSATKLSSGDLSSLKNILFHMVEGEQITCSKEKELKYEICDQIPYLNEIKDSLFKKSLI